MVQSTRPDLESKISSIRILDHNPQKPVVRMANLCVVSSHTVRTASLLTNTECIFIFINAQALKFSCPSTVGAWTFVKCEGIFRIVKYANKIIFLIFNHLLESLVDF